MNEILTAALAFEEAGCCVIRAAIDGSKAPLGQWKHYQSERPGPGQIITWFARDHPGLGVVTGAVSGGLEMLEFEGTAIRHGLLGEAREIATVAGLGEVWERVAGGYAEATPGGGVHLLYRVDGIPVPGNTKLAVGADRQVLAETRGEGGFVVVAPSHGPVHPTGKPWQLARGGPGTIAVLSAGERAALHSIIRTLGEQPQAEARFVQPAPASGSGWERLPGDDFNSRASWDDILTPRGWAAVMDRGGVRYWRRPGKADGISATTGRDGMDNLYVFSTSTEFDTEKPISKFHALAVLEHGGDHRAAAAALAAQGYGERADQDTKKEERTRAVLSAPTKEDESRAPAGPPVPVADPSMYTGILGDIVAAAAPTTEADPVGIYASLLAGAGCIIGPTPYVRIGNTHHPLLVWPLLLGRTGSGRKGEATSTAEIFLRNADAAAQALMVSGLSSGEGLIERIRDKDEEQEGQRFQQPGGTDDKRLLVLETEFASVLARSKREGSTLAAVQRQAWEGRALSVLNRKQLKASASHIAIIGHIPPQEFRLRLAEADMTGGTYNRYLPFFVERSKRLPIPQGVDQDVVAGLSERLRHGIGQARKVGAIQLGEEASQLWIDELYDELTAGDDDDLAEAEFTRRAAPYCLRIAGLFAALDGRRLMSKTDLASAAALIRYSIASARYILDRQLRDPRLDRIRRAVDTAGDDGLRRTEVSALFSRNLPKAELDRLLAELVLDGRYEESFLPTRGRPAQTYRRVVSSSFVTSEMDS